MKLYQLKKGAIIKEKTDDGSKYITFHKIDGMYSYCTTDKGNVIHLRANTELEPIIGCDKII